MSKRKVELKLVLPGDASQCDACVARLLADVSTLPGVEKAHVAREDPSSPKLCLHYNAATLRVEELEAVVDKTGAKLGAQYAHVSIPAVGLRHERQARLVEGVFARHPGVLSASASFGSRRIYVEFDPARTNRGALDAVAAKAGIASFEEPASPTEAEEEHDEHEHEHGGPFGERSELVFSLACGALTGVGWTLERYGVSWVATTSIFVGAYVLGAWFTLKEVVVALRARKFEIDFLMLLAAIGAAILGEWFEGALLLFLFTLGHGLEGYAMRRARNAIGALAKLVPETALRLGEGDGEDEVAVGELVIGDRILVKPNTRLPADGFVVVGSSSVNQAPITGESLPVDKRAVSDARAARLAPDSLGPEHRVFAGTINGASALTIVVTRAAGESTLARVVKMVAEAETQKSPTQQFTDRFERVFVPVIVAVVGALMLAWLVVDETFARSFYRAMAVLVRAIAFDKTGTLTEGKPKLTDVISLDGASDDELLALALAVEKQSDHPLASAIVEGARARRLSRGELEASSVEAVIGFGIRAMVAGVEVSIGKPGLFTGSAALPRSVDAAVHALQSQGRTVMVVRSGSKFLGVLGVMDTPRESATAVVAALHALGIEETILLTGDNQQVADAVAKCVGIRTARGDLLPEQKVAAIAELAKSKSRVAMVGDGVNDAPAMANATVGIAMGAGGSDVALETADVALMADDLRALPFAVELSRKARRIIRQNLWASLGMVFFLIPATIFGFAKIGAAVALHEGSTLLVVLNALRLLTFEPRLHK